MSDVGWGNRGRCPSVRSVTRSKLGAHFIKWNIMGQKGSKSKAPKSGSPRSAGTSPLNNATYWEAEEDPDWDNCVMVVATQKSRQYPTLRSSCSNDSLARSLHKEIDYSPLNVSRRSPDYQHRSPAIALAPDSRYPTSGQRKRQNTLLDTGWHACFKNNNYVFVRNSNGYKSERQFGDKWKENNDGDVTFVISTTKPVKEGHGEKLVVSLQDPKPKITRCSPPQPMTISKTSLVPNTNSNTTLSKRSDKKKTKGWLKKLRTPGRNRSLKIEASEDEMTPIFENGSEESPDSAEMNSQTLSRSVPQLTPKKCLNFQLSPSSAEEHKLPDSSVKPNATPVLNYDLNVRGPQTSTPKKESVETGRNIPRGKTTPYKLSNGRLSVRRKLPIDEMTPENCPLVNAEASCDSLALKTTSITSTKSPFIEEFECRSSLDVPISPIQKKGGCQNSGQRIDDTDIVSSIKLVQRRNSCIASNHQFTKENVSSQKSNIQRRLSSILPKSAQNDVAFNIRQAKTEPTKKSQCNFRRESILHPSPSNHDIPYADSEADVSFDDRPRRRLIPVQKGGSLSKSAPDVSFNTSCVDGVLDDNLPETIPASAGISPENKIMSTSEPVIGGEKSAKNSQIVGSPMEVEENVSLDQKTEDMLDSVDDSTVTFSPCAPKKPPVDDSPLSCWLKEIRLMTDNECLNALQAKVLLKEDWVPNSLAVGNAQESSENIWELGSKVKKLIDEMLKTLKSDTPNAPLSLKVAQLCSSTVEILKLSSTIQQLAQIQLSVRSSCASILETVNKNENGTEWKNNMKSELENIQKHVQILVQQVLLRELFIIVDCIDRADNMENLKRAVFALILLGRLNPIFCELTVKLDTVRSLLSICIEDKWREVHPCALRALTVLTSVPSAIRSFEKNGGVDCIADILCSDKSVEEARSEAAGLVAQITAPWTDGSAYVLQSVSDNADRLVKAIATIAAKTENSEVFLLTSAALANLSFTENALKKMKENQVLEILVDACRNKPHAVSLFIKDQVATVLANMAAKDDYRKEISSGGSLVLLMCFLQLRPSTGHGVPQLAACERVQQKAAIAIARLCSNPDTSNIVAEMQGIQRLVKLCKDRKERNDSDSVLVACLAALRKIAAVRQKEEFTKLGAQELVEPRLWDAFLAHSSKRESYV